MIEYDKIPHAANAEKSLLAMMTIDPHTIIPAAIAGGVNDEWFLIPAHRIIWQVLNQRFNNGESLDITSVMQHLADHGQLESVGGAAGLMNVFSYTTNTGLFKAHIADLRDKYNRRKIMDEANRAADVSTPYNPAMTAELAMTLTADTWNCTPNLSDAISRTLGEIDSMKNHGTHIRGVRTGFPHLDDSLGGLRGGTFNILAARPAMGKTALGMNIAINVARANKESDAANVLFLTAEMTSEQLAYRMLQTVGQVNIRDYSCRNCESMSEEEMRKRIQQAAAYIKKLPLEVVDISGWGVGRVSQFLTAEHRKKPLGLVVVDYVQMIKGDSKKATENTVEQISEASRGMKAIANKLGIPILGLAQVNRESAKSGASGKAPTLADLKGSGSLEQDADSVTFIHRPAYYVNNKSENAEDERYTELIVAKNRHGETGVHFARFYGEYSLFTESLKQ